jgi:D-sedoheptulose 7-phosphate isomerase
MKAYLENYIDEQRKALESIPVAAVEALIQVFKKALHEDRQIFVFGNGGSGANASHFVTDLGKGASDKTFRRFRCLSLNDNNAWITAIGNDYAYEDVFVRQLENFARPGDIAMTMSVSGNSPNLLKAIDWCKQKGVYTIALLGGQRGKLAGMADSEIIIDATHFGRVEDCHLHICHMICFAFMENEALQQP